jgi:hypothetical protein
MALFANSPDVADQTATEISYGRKVRIAAVGEGLN